MKFENTQVMNFKGALMGMRNPRNSWNRSDSYCGLINTEYDETDLHIAHLYLQKQHPEVDFSNYNYGLFQKEFDNINKWLIKNGKLQEAENDDICEIAFIGPNDMELAQKLILVGPEHRKFMRQIFVCVDITASLYW